jgi:hypothetical protein
MIRWTPLCMAVLFQASAAQAAVQPFPILQRLAVLENGRMWHEPQRTPMSFQVDVISDSEGIKYETVRDGKPFVAAKPGENYSVRLYNPLPVRVAVNLTVDGLNSLTGKPSGISDGAKWLIEPFRFIEIRGWQVNANETRRFFFTDKPTSYAQWRGEHLGKDLEANCGVIGAAFFWSQKDLNHYYDDHPQIRYTQIYSPLASQAAGLQNRAATRKSFGESRASLSSDAAAIAEKQQAGTGMGTLESHPTELIDFNYDTGMYKARQAVLIYYDFVHEPPPNPFPDMNYAPEMP